MIRAFLSCIIVFAAIGPALAQTDPQQFVDNSSFHFFITIGGAVWAAILALRAFNRPSRLVADVATYPVYMTSRFQYHLGSAAFVAFACGFFLVLVHFHQEVVSLLNIFPVPASFSKAALDAVKDRSTPYLLIVTGMGSLYLYLLARESDWNVLLMMRDVVQSWISIPQLASGIITQIRFSLRVPEDAISEVISNSREVVAPDFRKDRLAPDRIWAETCYMKWWLAKRLDRGEDATFFSEENLGVAKLLEDFQRTSLATERWKAGARDLAFEDLPQQIKQLRNKFSHLVACYLIYRNGSKKELCEATRDFGIDLADRAPENPLRYWIVYAVALVASVYIGVYASAIGYDFIIGKGIIFDQDQNRALAWIMYTLCNYGLAIFIILLFRLATRSLEVDVKQSHLITYCWTFLVAFVAGPIGLSFAIHFFGEGKFREMLFPDLYFYMLRWGLGPALVSVYISYYLDRQICNDLPIIDHTWATFAWRLSNSFAFAAVNVLLLLPPLLAITAQQNAIWDTSKLRFVATGCTFCLALGLALAAQFGLRMGHGSADPPYTPIHLPS
jgi:hypothetical protein